MNLLPYRFDTLLEKSNDLIERFWTSSGSSRIYRKFTDAKVRKARKNIRNTMFIKLLHNVTWHS